MKVLPIKQLSDIKNSAEDMKIYAAVHPFTPSISTLLNLEKFREFEKCGCDFLYGDQTIRVQFTLSVFGAGVFPVLSISYQTPRSIPSEEICRQIASYFFDDLSKVRRLKHTWAAQFVDVGDASLQK